MRWMPVVVQSERSDGSLLVTVGHPLVDAYLEFLNARARPNTVRAVAFDLKVFFSFVDKTPARVAADVMSFISAQRNGELPPVERTPSLRGRGVPSGGSPHASCSSAGVSSSCC